MVRTVQRLRALTEAECYARCYAAKTDTVRIVRLEPRRVRYATHVNGEFLRQHFEALLDARDPLAGDFAEPEAA